LQVLIIGFDAPSSNSIANSHDNHLQLRFKEDAENAAWKIRVDRDANG